MVPLWSVIGMYKCVQRAAFKHTLFEAAMSNIHLCAWVKWVFFSPHNEFVALSVDSIVLRHTLVYVWETLRV